MYINSATAAIDLPISVALGQPSFVAPICSNTPKNISFSKLLMLLWLHVGPTIATLCIQLYMRVNGLTVSLKHEHL